MQTNIWDNKISEEDSVTIQFTFSLTHLEKVCDDMACLAYGGSDEFDIVFEEFRSAQETLRKHLGIGNY